MPVSNVEGQCVSPAGTMLIVCWSYTNFSVSFAANMDEWWVSSLCSRLPLSDWARLNWLGTPRHYNVKTCSVARWRAYCIGSDILWLQHFWFEWFAPLPEIKVWSQITSDPSMRVPADLPPPTKQMKLSHVSRMVRVYLCSCKMKTSHREVTDLRGRYHFLIPFSCDILDKYLWRIVHFSI